MAGTNSHQDQQDVAVEYLRGGEITPRGVVAYITCESDGVDVIFNGNRDDCSHYAYGETLRVANPVECGHVS